MEQRLQAVADFRFQLGNPLQDGFRGFGGLVLIEIAGHGDLIAHLGLGPVDPGVGGVGQDLPGEIGVDVLGERDVFGVAQGGIGHRLALFQHGVSGFVAQGALDNDFAVAKGGGIKDLAFAIDACLVAVDGVVSELAVGPDDEIAAALGDVVPLGADGLAPGLEAMAGVDQLHLARPMEGLVLAQDPDIGGDARVHELVRGELDDGVQPVVLQNIAADLAGAAAGVAGEQGRAVLDDGHFAVGSQFGETIQHKELLTVGDLRQARAEPAQLAPGGFGLHRLLLPLPVDAEGRIGDAILEGEALELVVGQGVAEPHVVGVSAADHHVGLGNGEGGGVELLAEAGDLDIGVQIVDTLLHAGKHLAGAHGHVVDGDVALLRQIGVGEQQVRHEIDDVAAGEVGSRHLAEAFREAPHQVLEDVAAVHGADLVRAQIALGAVELLDDQVQRVAVHHALDHAVELELGQHVLHVGGEAGQIVAEVAFDVVRIGQESVEGELADVVELVLGGAAKEAVDDGQVFDLLIGVLHRLIGGQQAVMEPLHHRHGQDHQSVLVGFERPAQHVRHVPDHRRLLGDVRPNYVDLFVWHTRSSLFSIFSS